jgi:hypothetical protein
VPDDDTKQLAKDILDELDKPTSPEREAQLAEKERADREALEKFYIATGQIKPEQVMQRALVELADKIERMKAPVSGPFDMLELPIEIKGRKGTLRFAASPRKAENRYVELSIYSESGLSTSSQWLEQGTAEALVAYLRKPEVVADTLTTVDELMLSLSRNRLA